MKPTFLLSKGERRRMEFCLDTTNLIDRYRDIAVGMYAWDGLPDDCPKDFMESILFDVGSASIKKVKGLGLAVMGAKPVNLDIYGHPYKWLPTAIQGLSAMDRSSDLFKESDTPVLWLSSTAEKIRPYLTVMEQSLQCLSQNLNALQTPVIVSGNVGNELDGLVLMDELQEHKTFIPSIKNPGAGVQILDLKAQDRTQNLISCIRAMDSEILSVMGVSNGTEKSSGVTDVETLSTVQELTMKAVKGLELRQEWCDAINDKLKIDVSVSFGDGYSMPGDVIENDEPDDGIKEGEENEA